MASMPLPNTDGERRFWAKVQPTGFCWEWTAVTSYGYGKFAVRKDGKMSLWMAHRLAYTLLVGPVPEGLDLDHLCRNHGCVNPDHVVPKTRRENTLAGFNPAAKNARKDRCLNGHLFSVQNTRVTKDGGRVCRACHAEYERARRASLHAPLAADAYRVERPPE